MQNQRSPNVLPRRPCLATAIRDLQREGPCLQGRRPCRPHSSRNQEQRASGDRARPSARGSLISGRRSLQRTKQQRASSSHRDARAQRTQKVESRGQRSRTMSQAGLIVANASDAASSNVSKFMFYYNISCPACEIENDARWSGGDDCLS